MDKHTTKITSKSIEQGGVPVDYKKAISEYIWNGFDAGATTIQINFEGNEIGFLQYVTIEDDGCGINIAELDSTFGHFLDSQKTGSYDREGFIKGRKGKGRYAFNIFANNCTWYTRFKGPSGHILEYNITIDKSDQQNFTTTDKQASTKKTTGTKVQIYNFFDLTSDLLESQDFKDSLSAEFGWFLFLNKDRDVQILINEEPLEYNLIISESETFTKLLGDYHFTISFIRWDRRIGDKYFYYFLNSSKKENSRKHTSFNNKTIDFHHSIYIESPYFDDFKETPTDNPVLAFSSKNQSDIIFKQLIGALHEYVTEKEKLFIRDSQANKLIAGYYETGVFPTFKNNEYDNLRKKDLETTVRELYCIQPKIFQGLKREQSKTMVGFLNILLDTDQREKVLDILEEIVNLSDEERKDLADTLKKTRLSNISAMVRLLESRYSVVESLKLLVFDLERFTTERNHIQSAIEANYWLFGEQYHLISADQQIELLLNNYLKFIEENPSKPPVSIDNKEKLKRPDIFICRQSEIPDSVSEYTIEENIIVELKRPTVIIGKEQFDQVEGYLRIITQEAKFNSQLRKWKFIIIGKSLDTYITDKHESQKNKGKRFLVESIKNYEIYAFTWDDLFRQFEIKHKHLIDKLEFRTSILEDLKDKGFAINRESSDAITSDIINQQTPVRQN